MGFLDSRSQSLPRSWRVGMPIVLGVLAFILYALNLAPAPEPDGAALLELAQTGHWLHAQHLIAGLPLYALLQIFPAHDPALLGGWLSAASGGLAVGALCSLGLAMGLGRGGAALSAALVALTQGWWAHGTAYEVHILAVGLTLLAAAVAVQGKRPVLLGVLLALAVLCHKTMVLAVPGVVLASLSGSDRKTASLAKTLVVLGLGVCVPYILALLSQLGTERSVQQIATELLLGELREGANRPLNEQVPMRARHALAYALARLPEPGRGRDPMTWALSGLLFGLPLLGSALHWRLRPEHRHALLLWLWPLLALPAIWSFEAGNYEYYLGPLAVLILLSAASLPERFSWALLLPLLGLGAWNSSMEQEPVKVPHREQPRRPGPARNPTSR